MLNIIKVYAWDVTCETCGAVENGTVKRKKDLKKALDDWFNVIDDRYVCVQCVIDFMSREIGDVD